MRNAIFLALSLLIAGGCSKKEAPPGMTHVTFALNWVPEPEFGGFYAARDEGTFRAQGLDVEIRGGGAGVPVMQMVATGQIEYGIAGADEILAARARGADVVALFATYQTSPQAIMVHKSRGITSIGEALRTGTVAMEPGVAYASFLRKKFGEPKASIVPYDGGSTRFLTDPMFAQQCYITAEPIAAKRKGADPQVLLIADEGFNPYIGVVITRRAMWNEKPAQVRAFVRAIQDGWRKYLDAPAPANEVMRKLNPSMDAESFQKAAEAQKPLIDVAKVGSMTKERWELLEAQLREIGVLKQPVPIDFLANL